MQVRELNRLQLPLQQLKQLQQQQQQQQQNQQAHLQDQGALQFQSHSAASTDVSQSSLLQNPLQSSAVRCMLQAGASQLCARAAYATSASVAAMQQPHLSLQAVAAAANLLHERAAVRQGRVAALELAVVDLCGGSASAAAGGFEGEGAALKRHGRCLQVLRIVRPSLIYLMRVFFRQHSTREYWLGNLGRDCGSRVNFYSTSDFFLSAHFQ